MLERTSGDNILTKAATLTIALEHIEIPGLSRRIEAMQPATEAALTLITLTRPPRQEDFADLSKLFFDRRVDMTPGHPLYPTQPDASEYRKSEDRWLQIREMTRVHPEQYFAQDVIINGRMGGYIVAEAPPDDEFSWCRGIAVAREFQGRGVGGYLVDIMLSWAQRVGRSIRAEIAERNQSSMALLT